MHASKEVTANREKTSTTGVQQRTTYTDNQTENFETRAKVYTVSSACHRVTDAHEDVIFEIYRTVAIRNIVEHC